MIGAALLMALQAAPTPPLPMAAAAKPVVGERFSILVDPCANASNDGGDVVVCGHPEAISPRLPLPRFRGVPDHAVPSNPDLSARVALDGPGIGTECGAYGEGCPVGGGGYAIPALVNGAIGLVGKAFAKRPDKTGRVAIPLDDPDPSRPDPSKPAPSKNVHP